MRKIIKKWFYGSCPGFSGSFPYYGIKVYFPKKSVLFYRACQEGIYECTAIRILSNLLRDNTYFFDVGANIGLISIPLLKNNSKCTGVAFEPSPNTLPYLRRTVYGSELKTRFLIVEKAVGAVTGELDFSLSEAELGAYEGFKSTGRAPVNTIVKVPVTTIDTEWIALGRPSVSVIKIDVEGAEADVFVGANACIQTTKPYVFIEWNAVNLVAYGTPPDALLKIASTLEYGLYAVPSMIKINSDNELKVHMIFTENFLLCPL
jgi:FkbM family methyltransferase